VRVETYTRRVGKVWRLVQGASGGPSPRPTAVRACKMAYGEYYERVLLCSMVLTTSFTRDGCSPSPSY